MLPRRRPIYEVQDAKEGTVPDDLFIEIESCQHNKHGQDICGDSFMTHKLPEEDRVISVLSDGLGHGLKA
ncbi:MAG: hypothetical protein GYA56_14630, partial [Geobacteraceae bacterium]|nr:hypothetical protein [Geobacteraceae bacterium]